MCPQINNDAVCMVCLNELYSIEKENITIFRLECSHLICCQCSYKMKQNYYQIKCPYCKHIGEKFKVKYNKGLCSSCNKSLNELNSNVYHMGCIHLFCSNCIDIKRNVLCTICRTFNYNKKKIYFT